MCDRALPADTSSWMSIHQARSARKIFPAPVHSVSLAFDNSSFRFISIHLTDTFICRETQY
jgi:hypothetical protein